MPISVSGPSSCAPPPRRRRPAGARRRPRRPWRARASPCKRQARAVTPREPQQRAGELDLLVADRSFSRRLTQRQPAASAAARMSASGSRACLRSVTSSSGGSGSLTCRPGRIAGSTARRGRASGCGRRAAPQRPGFDRRAHRGRHRHRIARLRDGGVEQHRRAAELHGERRVGGGADAGVEHDRHRRARADQLDQMRVADAQPGADRRAERHHGGGAGVGELAADDRIVVQ